MSTPLETGWGQTCFPAGSTLESPDIAPFWDDFDPGAAGEVYYRHDTAPQRFIVSWEGVPIWNESAYGTVSFQVHLFPSGNIQFHWSDVYFGASSTHNYGASATVGIENRVAAYTSWYLSRSCNSSALSAGTATVFTAPCGDVDGDGFDDLGCGGSDCDDLEATVWPGATELCDGLDNDCDGASDFDVLGEVDGDADGYRSCDGDCDDSDANAWPAAPELCDGVDQDCAGLTLWEIAVTAWDYSNTAADFFRGNVLVPNDDVVLDEVLGYFQSGPSQSVTFLVWESLNGGLSYSLLASRAVVVTGGIPDWWSTGGWGVPLVGGRTYAIGAWWPDSLLYQLQTGLPMPYAASWATHTGGAALDGATSVPSSLGWVGSTNAYGFRYRVQGEGDNDGDTYMSCADCDDQDAAVRPGALEICDGSDTNCDGILPLAENNADSDVQAVCEGDCDDSDSTVWDGAPEICDAQDNDCDGVTPFTEVGDPDADGWAGCVDCGPTDPLVHPGAGEVCDGVDTDCDVLTLIGGVWGLESGGSPVTSSGRYRGNIWDIDAPAVLTTVEANLTIPSGSALNWLVYRSSTQSGSYTLVAQTASTAATAAATWHESPSLDLPLEPGWYYAVGVHFVAAANLNSVTSPGYPIAQPFGSMVAGASYTSATVLTLSTLSTPTGYLVRWNSQGELDDDGDGSPSCLDCDDNDAARAPGQPELCDGVDTDCDGLPGLTEVDGDADGFAVCDGDCNDALAATWPGAPEVCDGADNNCDGASLAPEVDADGDGVRACASDCDDANAGRFPGNPEICDGIDQDCDGTPDADAFGEADSDGDGQRTCGGDCDDTSPARYTGATELCNGTDDDCNGSPDADAALEVDVDGDGSRSCADCDDASAQAFPGNAETCDGLDNDCIGGADFGGGEADADGDGFRACAECNDASPFASPAGVEVCDGLDNDCDPATTELGDQDADDFSICDGDCDDGNGAVHPSAVEACNGIDDDCDPTTDELVDGDLDLASICDGDCDDENAAIHEGAEEVCDGQDSDCDSNVPSDEQDGDGDSFPPCLGDCDDGAAGIFPGAPETCDGIDENCEDGTDDESVDEDGDGTTPCDGDCDDTSAAVHPGADEGCDGLDTDCVDGVPAIEADVDGDGYAACEGDCEDGDPTANPEGVEEGELLCADDLDNDCDGATDGNDTACGGTGEGDDDDATSGTDDPRGCACGVSDSGGSALALLPALLLLRRRRSP
jgi:hypothetical protein